MILFLFSDFNKCSKTLHRLVPECSKNHDVWQLMQFSADQDAQKIIKFIQYKSMNFRLGQVKWIWSKWTEYLDELKKIVAA